MCGSSEGSLHEATERMFGLGGAFSYLECASCGSLTLVDVPADLGRYYPPYYYSYNADTPAIQDPSRSVVTRWAVRKRNEAQIFRRGGFWGWLANWKPRPDLEQLPTEVAYFGRKTLDCRILDVGCGDGAWLRRFGRAGFSNLLGVDPFLARERDEDAVRLRRCSLEALPAGHFDVVFFNHSLEHVDDPARVVRAAFERLNDGGVLIIRIPLAQGRLWREHGARWVELDAPRHICVPTRDALISMCTGLGFVLRSVSAEEEAFGLWATELYLRNITLVDPDTLSQRTPDDYFSRDELLDYSAKARALNQRGDAGRGKFIFTK